MVDFLRGDTLQADAAEVPVGRWFHMVVYWQRAADPTGAFALYIDGAVAVSVTDLVTDESETAEWYVGNYAAMLTPTDNTLYVDDVTISSTGP